MAYRISQAAAASGLSVKAIRYYERIGLMPPAARTNGGVYASAGRRLFSKRDIGRLQFIHRARVLGLKPGQIRELLDTADGRCPASVPEYRKMLEQHLARMEAQMRHLRILRGHVRMLLEHAPDPVQECFEADCSCLDTDRPSPSSQEVS
ncbi:MAG: MerR family transcriptional regulator [Gammaproteobacteria bacterium]|nr:MerR family transcriptional regulator [Gammaproteobacteria bacterium]